MKNKIIVISIIAVIIIGGVLASITLHKGTTKTVGNAVEMVEVVHELGTTIVQKNPANVVVFDYGVLDTLDLLGVPVAGIPKETIPSYLSKYEAETYIDLGGLKEPHMERIYELKPDLIIISGRQKDFYTELSKIAPTVYLPISNLDYMESFEKNTRILGELFDQVETVETHLSQIKSSLQALQSSVWEKEYNALIILSNNGDLSAYSEKSRFGIIHKYMGFKSMGESEESSTHGSTISNEYILQKNPNYIFVVDRAAVVGGDVSAQKEFSNQIIQETDAYKNNRIIFLDAEIWYISPGGLQSTPLMIQEVRDAALS
ncbi:MAG: siderophore ABC transporter substrate-binding protein [Oscillospiraceae bacterium]